MDSCCSNEEGLKPLNALFSCKPGLRVQIRAPVCFLGQVPAFSLSQATEKVKTEKLKRETVSLKLQERLKGKPPGTNGVALC